MSSIEVASESSYLATGCRWKFRWATSHSMTDSPQLDWTPVLNCREFWLKYFWLTDDKFFQPQEPSHRKNYSKLFTALRASLRGRTLNIPLSVGFTWVLKFGDRETLHLTQDGKRKQNLLGWVDPHSYNHAFRFEEISKISILPECPLPSHVVFLLLLGYWGITDADVSRYKSIGQAIARNLRELDLFDRTEIAHTCSNFENAHKRPTECAWVEHPKWGFVADSPMSLRCPDSIDIPDGVTFNFRLFTQFMNAVENA